MLSRILGMLCLLVFFVGAASIAMPAQSFSDLTDMMGRYMESRALLTAVELDIFTAVGPGDTGVQVSEKLGTNPRATETLLNALVALGALTKKDGTFFNTPDTARYLVAGSPDYAQPALMHTVDMFAAWATLTDCVRAGTAVRPPGVEQQEQRWTESFIAAMHRGAERTAAQVVRAVGVTAEVGRSGDPRADAKALEGLRAFLGRDPLFPDTPPPPLQRLVSPMRATLRPGVRVAVADAPARDSELTVLADLDRHNFETVAAGVTIAWVTTGIWHLELRDAEGQDRSRDFFRIEGDRLVARRPFVPIMITTDPEIARSDCLLYVVSALPPCDSGAA